MTVLAHPLKSNYVINSHVQAGQSGRSGQSVREHVEEDVNVVLDLVSMVSKATKDAMETTGKSRNVTQCLVHTGIHGVSLASVQQDVVVELLCEQEFVLMDHPEILVVEEILGRPNHANRKIVQYGPTGRIGDCVRCHVMVVAGDGSDTASTVL